MLRTALSTAALAVFALTTQAQHGPKAPIQAGKAIDTAGKATIPIGPRLAGEEKLSAQERAERTFLMPPRKKMPSVQPAHPQLDPANPEAVAIGTAPAAEDAPAEEAKTEAAKPAATPHHTTVRRHRSTRSHNTSSRKKTVTKKKTSSKKRRR